MNSKDFILPSIKLLCDLYKNNNSEMLNFENKIQMYGNELRK